MNTELLRASAETFAVGKLHISMYATEHDEAAIEAISDPNLLALIDSHHAVLLEYFPYEFSNLLQNHPLLKTGNYKTTVQYFNLLSNLIHSRNKPIWLADPAYSLAHIELRKRLMIPTLGSTLAMYGITAGTIPIIERMQKSETTAADPYRRFLLKGATSLAVASFLGGSFSTPLFKMIAGKIPEQERVEVWMKYERFIRRVLIAYKLNYIEKHESKAQSVLMVYPKEHSKQIQQLLINTENLQTHAIHVLKILRLLDIDSEDFHLFRKYDPLSNTNPPSWRSNHIIVPRPI